MNWIVVRRVIAFVAHTDFFHISIVRTAFVNGRAIGRVVLIDVFVACRRAVSQTNEILLLLHARVQQASLFIIGCAAQLGRRGGQRSSCWLGLIERVSRCVAQCETIFVHHQIGVIEELSGRVGIDYRLWQRLQSRIKVFRKFCVRLAAQTTRRCKRSYRLYEIRRISVAFWTICVRKQTKETRNN